MIKVVRKDKPAILMKHEKKWIKNINTALVAHNNHNLENAIGKYKHEDIRKQLKLMFHGRCAYCESKISHIAYPHIEHYRPKSKYPLLAVKWTNLLLSCERCNSSENKGDKFPTTKLLNPCVDEPNQHFIFEYDKNTELANILGITARGMMTETTLNLNRVDLLQHRSTYIKKLIFIALYYRKNVTAKELFDEAMNEENDNAEYLAFARMIKEKYIDTQQSN